MVSIQGASYALSVSLPTLDPQQQPATLALLAGSAVKALEVWELGFPRGAGQVQAARDALAAAGVRVRSVHAAFGQQLDISASDPAVRDAGLAAVRAALDLAVELGGEIVIVHPSAEPIAAEVRAGRMQQSKRSLEFIAQMARAAGCRVAIELLPRSCLGRTAGELLDLIADLDPETAGICLDTNHLMDQYAALPDVVHQLGPRLIALHCSDYDGVDEKHWPPMRGVVDWTAFLGALDEIGFRGPINYEARLDGETLSERLAFLEANYARLLERKAAR